MPFFQALNFRAAGRVSDYSTVGSVNTYSLGVDWAPIDMLRFRATYAKAVRAPNIGELFTGPSQTFPTGLSDPCVGVTLATTGTIATQCRVMPGVLANIAANGVFTVTQPDKQGISGFNSGNPDLGVEKSRSITAGVVFNPRSIPALRNLVVSVDYYNIEIKDAIVAARPSVHAQPMLPASGSAVLRPHHPSPGGLGFEQRGLARVHQCAGRQRR